jgi:hypothetical protein
MIELGGQELTDCGWAGPLLWLVTEDGWSIHLYDAPIRLGHKRVEAHEDIRKNVVGQTIQSISATKSGLSVNFESGGAIIVDSSDTETARIFKKGSDIDHLVYKSGDLGNF